MELHHGSLILTDLYPYHAKAQTCLKATLLNTVEIYFLKAMIFDFKFITLRIKFSDNLKPMEKSVLLSLFLIFNQ